MVSAQRPISGSLAAKVAVVVKEEKGNNGGAPWPVRRVASSIFGIFLTLDVPRGGSLWLVALFGNEFLAHRRHEIGERWIRASGPKSSRVHSHPHRGTERPTHRGNERPARRPRKQFASAQKIIRPRIGEMNGPPIRGTRGPQIGGGNWQGSKGSMGTWGQNPEAGGSSGTWAPESAWFGRRSLPG